MFESPMRDEGDMAAIPPQAVNLFQVTNRAQRRKLLRQLRREYRRKTRWWRRAWRGVHTFDDIGRIARAVERQANDTDA